MYGISSSKKVYMQPCVAGHCLYKLAILDRGHIDREEANSWGNGGGGGGGGGISSS